MPIIMIVIPKLIEGFLGENLIKRIEKKFSCFHYNRQLKKIFISFEKMIFISICRSYSDETPDPTKKIAFLFSNRVKYVFLGVNETIIVPTRTTS